MRSTKGRNIGGRDRGHQQPIADDDQREDHLQQGIDAVDEAAAVAVGHFPRGPGEVAVSPGRLQQGQVRLAEQTAGVQALQVVAAGLQVVAGGPQAALDRPLRIKRCQGRKGLAQGPLPLGGQRQGVQHRGDVPPPQEPIHARQVPADRARVAQHAVDEQPRQEQPDNAQQRPQQRPPTDVDQPDG